MPINNTIKYIFNTSQIVLNLKNPTQVTLHSR